MSRFPNSLNRDRLTRNERGGSPMRRRESGDHQLGRRNRRSSHLRAGGAIRRIDVSSSA